MDKLHPYYHVPFNDEMTRDPYCTHEWEFVDERSPYSDADRYQCSLCGDKGQIGGNSILSISFIEDWYRSHNHDQSKLAKISCPGC